MKNTRYILGVIIAYLLWGIMPIIYKQIKDIGAIEILAIRMIVSFFYFLVAILIKNEFKNLFKPIDLKSFILLLISIVLILVNWLIFISGTISNNVLSVSLGYFMCPIVKIILGVIILKEKLDFVKKIGLILAALGVIILGIHLGRVPYISISLAFCFSFYVLLRKIINLDPLISLFYESLTLFPFFLAYLIYLKINSNLSFDLYNNTYKSLVCISVGIISPSIFTLFMSCSKHLNLTILGFINYIEPTFHFFLGIFLFHESIDLIQLCSFILIWLALVLISIGASIKAFILKKIN